MLFVTLNKKTHTVSAHCALSTEHSECTQHSVHNTSLALKCTEHSVLSKQRALSTQCPSPSRHSVLSASIVCGSVSLVLSLWGLQSRHYVRVGNRIMGPQRQCSHKLTKWLKNAGCRIDITSMDNMFATFHAHSSGKNSDFFHTQKGMK